MRYRGLILATSMLAISWALLAVTPQFWENFTQDELLKGTLTRVSLGPEGKLFLAPAYDLVFDTGQPYIFSMVRDKAGNLYLGTGHEGKVFKVDPQGKGSLYFQSKELDVFALALDPAGTLYVGTSPDGKVYKVTGPNQATEFCNPEAKYIWALLFDDAGNLYVGTGGRGAILKVTSNGEKSTLYNPGDSNVICLARESGGNLLAGTSPGGMLVEVDAKGKAFTLLDTPMEEIHSMAVDRFGTIYVAATSSKAGPKEGASTTVQTTGGALPAGGIQILASMADKSKEAKTSVTAPGGEKDAGGAKSSIIAIAKSGGAETIYSSEDRMVYDLVVRSDDTLLAATGGKGRLLSIDAAKQVTVVTDSPEEQMTRLAVAGDVIFVAGSNQGKVYRLESQQAQSGTFESRVMDAKVIASWGKISWRFTNPSGGSVKISTRTGNTEKADNSWSDWSAPYTASGQQVTNPKARYMQWRATFERGTKPAANDSLEAVQIAYLQENMRPQVVGITVIPSGVALQKMPSTTLGTTVNLSSTTSDGQSLNSPRLRGRETNPMPPRQALQPGAQSFTWKATDDNDDILEYSVYFKGEGESDWKPLAKELKDTFYTLDGTALPDGTYRMKVVATDAPSNPYGKALIGELVSKPFVISNTTPTITITSHNVNGKRVEILFHAKIGAGHIASGEFSIDGGDWFLVFPSDGIADSPDEDFQVTTPELSAGEHMIGLRASDGNGNTGTTKLVVKIL